MNHPLTRKLSSFSTTTPVAAGNGFSLADFGKTPFTLNSHAASQGDLEKHRSARRAKAHRGQASLPLRETPCSPCLCVFPILTVRQDQTKSPQPCHPAWRTQDVSIRGMQRLILFQQPQPAPALFSARPDFQRTPIDPSFSDNHPVNPTNPQSKTNEPPEIPPPHYPCGAPACVNRAGRHGQLIVLCRSQPCHHSIRPRTYLDMGVRWNGPESHHRVSLPV